VNKRIIIAAVTAAAVALPAAAIAKPGHDRDAAKVHRTAKKGKKAKTVKFVFKGTFTAPGTVEVLSGNSHVRKGGFVGEAVSFDFAGAKVVAADTNGDANVDVTDVKTGDLVLVQARAARRTKYAEGADAIVAHKLIDKTNAPVEDDEAVQAPVGDDSAAS
jgi:hypothetical protein